MAVPTKIVIVEDYNPMWKNEFEILRNRYEEVIGDYIISIEHVGSTSVYGLAAKPIIDIDIVFDIINFEKIKEGLAILGYSHNGDQGIKGREAFRLPRQFNDTQISHNLYVCDKNANELKKHLAFRDYLRNHKEIMEEYGNIKKEAALNCNNDIEKYMDFKGKFVTEHVRNAMIWSGITPKPQTRQCQNCSNMTITHIFQMKYLSDGYITEYFDLSCDKCGHKWKEMIE